MESQQQKRHSFRALLFAPPQGPDALPKTLPPPPPAASLPPSTKPRSDSHVRLRAQTSAAPDVEIEFLDALELLDDLGDEHAVEATIDRNALHIARRRPGDPVDGARVD
jgi:hypothetical protein